MEKKEPWARLPRELLRVVARKHGDAFAREAAEAVAARFVALRRLAASHPVVRLSATRVAPPPVLNPPRVRVLLCRSAPRARVASGAKSERLGEVVVGEQWTDHRVWYPADGFRRHVCADSFAKNVAGRKGAHRYTLVAARPDGTLVKAATAVHDSRGAVERMLCRFLRGL